MIERLCPTGGRLNINLQVFDRVALPNEIVKGKRAHGPVSAIADLPFGGYEAVFVQLAISHFFQGHSDQIIQIRIITESVIGARDRPQGVRLANAQIYQC